MEGNREGYEETRGEVDMDNVITPIELRFTILGMKASIIQYLSAYHREIAAGIEKAVTEYLDSINWEELVRQNVRDVLSESIRYAIQDAVRGKFEKHIREKSGEIADNLFKNLNKAEEK